MLTHTATDIKQTANVQAHGLLSESKEHLMYEPSQLKSIGLIVRADLPSHVSLSDSRHWLD